VRCVEVIYPGTTNWPLYAVEQAERNSANSETSGCGKERSAGIGTRMKRWLS